MNINEWQIPLFKAVSQLNVYHFYSKNVNDDEKW